MSQYKGQFMFLRSVTILKMSDDFSFSVRDFLFLIFPLLTPLVFFFPLLLLSLGKFEMNFTLTVNKHLAIISLNIYLCMEI